MQTDQPPASINELEPGLLDGLREPTKDLLVQMLLYKSAFTGRTFRMLAQREPPEIRDPLLVISRETLVETAAVAVRMRQWDAHPVAWDTMEACTRLMRRRLLEDFLTLKEGMTEAGLIVAMRAPTDALRAQLTNLVDMDRRHADTIRRLLGSHTAGEHLQAPPSAGNGTPLGAAEGRGSAASLSGAVQATLRKLQGQGIEPTRIVVSADGLRHLRDEGVVDAGTGQAFGLYIEIDMGWQGDCYAVETRERVGYSELLVAARAQEI